MTARLLTPIQGICCDPPLPDTYTCTLDYGWWLSPYGTYTLDRTTPCSLDWFDQFDITFPVRLRLAWNATSGHWYMRNERNTGGGWQVTFNTNSVSTDPCAPAGVYLCADEESTFWRCIIS